MNASLNASLIERFCNYEHFRGTLSGPYTIPSCECSILTAICCRPEVSGRINNSL